MSKQVLIKAELVRQWDESAYVEVKTENHLHAMIIARDQIHTRKPNQSKALLKALGVKTIEVALDRIAVLQHREDTYLIACDERNRLRQETTKLETENKKLKEEVLSLQKENTKLILKQHDQATDAFLNRTGARKAWNALVKSIDGRHYFASQEYFTSLEAAISQCLMPGEVVALIPHTEIILPPSKKELT